MKNENEILDKKEEDNILNKKIVNKVSPKRKHIEAFGKTINNKDLPNLIRTKFGKSLEKLNSTDTKDVGFNELKETISLHNNQNYIRIYYSLLSVYNKNFSVSAKELQMILIGYISSIFKDSLIDTSEKPSSLNKTISKFINIIFNFLSKEKNIAIVKACCLSFCELYNNCINIEDSNTLNNYFIDPLISFIQNSDTFLSKDGSCQCLSDFILSLIEMKSPYLESVALKLFNFFQKTSNKNPYLLEGLNILIENLKFSIFRDRIQLHIEKLLDLIDNSDSQESKLELCKSFLIIAYKLKLYEDNNFKSILVQNCSQKILSKLDILCQDRNYKVQTLAKETLSEWNCLKNNQNESSEIINKYANRQNKLNILRNMSKINKAKCTTPEILKKEIYNKGIGVLMKTSNFLSNRELSSSKLSSKSKLSKSINMKNKNNSESFRNFIKQIKTVNNFNKVNNKFEIFFKDKGNNKNSNNLNEQADEVLDRDIKLSRNGSNNFIDENIVAYSTQKIKEIDVEDQSNRLENENRKTYIEEPILNEEINELNTLKNSLERCCEVEEENKGGAENFDENYYSKEVGTLKEEKEIKSNQGEELNHSYNPIPQSIDIKSKLRKEKVVNKLNDSRDQLKTSEIIKNNHDTFKSKIDGRVMKDKVIPVENFFPKDIDAINCENINEFSSFNKNTKSSISLNKDLDKSKENPYTKKSELEKLSETDNLQERSIHDNNIIPHNLKQKHLRVNNAKNIKDKDLSLSNSEIGQPNSKSLNDNILKSKDECRNIKGKIDSFSDVNHKLNTKPKETSNKSDHLNDEKEKQLPERITNYENKNDINNNQIKQNTKEGELSNKSIHKSENNKENSLKIYYSIVQKISKSFEQMSDDFEKKVQKRLSILNTKLRTLEHNVNESIKLKPIKTTENTIKIKDSVDIIDIDKCSQKNKSSEINNIWSNALQYLKNEQHEEAYKTILNSGDDIHLLRLCNVTGSVLDKLSFSSSSKVLQRLCLISRSNHINFLIFKIVKHSFDLSIFENLSEELKNDLLDVLYEFSSSINPNLSNISSELYNYIINSL